jgi:hypothetical protein
MQFTLKELLESYKVVIPQIQRDYAQGRKNELELRKGFISKISEALSQGGEKLNLDFIYGYAEDIKDGQPLFVPLDGQQRLTTLWLLHWFLAPKDELLINDKANSILGTQEQQYLKHFTYSTRVSSKRFFKSLVTKPIETDSELRLSQRITNSPWFMSSWGTDPTIIAVLNMLDTLEEEKIGESEYAWDYLVSKRQITFDYIDIKSDEFKLTDELYIKMNSRGKPLTPFENFKAMFSGLLASKDTSYHDEKLQFQGADVSYQQYFAFNVDGKWMDLFWKYRLLPGTTIDICFLNFITYIAEFRYFRKNDQASSLDVKRDYEFLTQAFRDQDDVEFLFNALDFLAELPDVEAFFGALFQDISTFDGQGNNYFLKAITNANFDVMDKVILYGILYYGIGMEVSVPDTDYNDFVRILRNLLLTVRQPNQSKRIEYSSNLRLPNIPDYSKFIEGLGNACVKEKDKSTYEVLSEKRFSGFTRDAIQHEQDKARIMSSDVSMVPIIHTLEEHQEIRGNTVNFDIDSDASASKIKSFIEIWSPAVPDSLITRGYLTVEDFSVKIHDYSSLGEIWYFGSKGNWNRILTATDREEQERISVSLNLFLEAYDSAIGTNAEEKLTYLIDNYESDHWDWRRYFIVYPQITNDKDHLLNVYAWNDSKGFDINHLGNSGKQPLHSYHRNPYLMVVSQLFETTPNVKHYDGRFADESLFSIEGKLSIYSSSEGWTIYLQGDYQIDAALVSKYSIIAQKKHYLLEVPDEKNRIEIAEEFIKDIL